MPWFPKLSPDGTRLVVQGDKRLPADEYYPVLLDGAEVGVGLSPCWLGPTVLYANGTRVLAYGDGRTGILHECGKAINLLISDGESGWAAWHGGDEWTWRMPLLRPPAPAIEYRFASGMSAWVEHFPGGPVCMPAMWAPWGPKTHLAVPVACPDPWILRLEDDRLVLHPKGQSEGVSKEAGLWADCQIPVYSI